MTAAHRRAARREREAAAILGTRRVLRSRYQKAPDVERVQARLSGRWVQAESKTRGRLPKWITSALLQAQTYGAEGDIAVVLVSEIRGRAIAIVDARDLATLAGLGPEGEVKS